MNCGEISLTNDEMCQVLFNGCIAKAAVELVDLNSTNSFSFASKNDLMLRDFWETSAIFKSMC